MTHLCLHVERPGFPRRTFIASSDEFCAGSGPGVQLPLPDPLIEACHVRFFYSYRTWWLEPASPSAIVFYPGQLRLREEAPLDPDLPIRVGPFVIRPEFEPPLKDRYHLDEGVIVASRSEWGQQSASLNEIRRLRIFINMRRAARNMQGVDLLRAFLSTTRSVFPDSSCAVLHYGDEQFLPVPSDALAQNEFSVTLALRCMQSRRAFLWERALASQASGRIESLQGVCSAIYCPLVEGFTVRGVLAIHSKRLDCPLDEPDIDAAVELCRVLATRVYEVEAEAREAKRVFLSYSHSDEETAAKIAAFLRRQAIDVWMDGRLPLGSDWRDYIEQAISSCDVFLVLLPAMSLPSEVVEWEIKIAEANSRIIIPLVSGDPPNIPPDLSRRQYLRVDRMDSAVLSRLARAISGMGVTPRD